jgi:hypothetical protein
MQLSLAKQGQAYILLSKFAEYPTGIWETRAKILTKH